MTQKKSSHKFDLLSFRCLIDPIKLVLYWQTQTKPKLKPECFRTLADKNVNDCFVCVRMCANMGLNIRANRLWKRLHIYTYIYEHKCNCTCHIMAVNIYIIIMCFIFCVDRE